MALYMGIIHREGKHCGCAEREHRHCIMGALREFAYYCCKRYRKSASDSERNDEKAARTWGLNRGIILDMLSVLSFNVERDRCNRFYAGLIWTDWSLCGHSLRDSIRPDEIACRKEFDIDDLGCIFAVTQRESQRLSDETALDARGQGQMKKATQGNVQSTSQKHDMYDYLG